MELNHVLGIFSPAHTPSLPKLLVLLPQTDSNHLLQIQNLPCCHYTMGQCCSEGRIRTYEVKRQRIYSPSSLTSWSTSEYDAETKGFEPLRRFRLSVFRTGAISQLCQVSSFVTRERFELPTPTFVASCSVQLS